MYSIRVLVGFHKGETKVMDIDVKECLIDEEILLLAEKMFPNWVDLNPAWGEEGEPMVRFKNGANSYSVCRF